MPYPDGRLRTGEVAARLGVAPQTVRRWMKDGDRPEVDFWPGRRRERAFTEQWVVDTEHWMRREND
jgi:predicted site-specific integrase-resolvase